ncbi:MAG: GTPase ObgE [Bacteroidota bacterium]
MQFIDEATIYVKAGNGGKGVVSFRREKFIPKGGPDGGNGGKGGSVILKADRQLSTLLDFRYKQKYNADNGNSGMASNKSGRDGQDLIIRIPCGTSIYNSETNELITDLVEDADEYIIAKGGKGGRGNGEFATPTNQAPRYSEPGIRGKENDILLSLKLIADVGFVGLPNAGKSTLISRVSAAKPKIADYPFTTLIPNLGIVRVDENKSFVVADMPGIIEGAHEGRGLGIQFLKHIERTKLLLLLIDSSSENPKEVYELLLNELGRYNEELIERRKIIVLTKSDILDDAQKKKIKKLKFGKSNTVHIISAVAGDGIAELIAMMWKELQQLKSESE